MDRRVGVQNSAYRPARAKKISSVMKRTELTFSAILVPVDYCMVLLAGFLAYQLRFGGIVAGIRPVFYEFPLRQFLPLLFISATGFALIFAISGLYAIRGTKRFLDECTNVFLACSTGIMAIIVLFFFSREFFSSRFIILSGWVLSILLVTFGRVIVRTVQRSMLKRSIGAYRVVLLGGDTTAYRLLQLFERTPSLGYQVVTHIPSIDPLVLRTLAEQHAEKPFDVIFQADPSLPKEQVLQLIDFTNEHHITFQYAADLFETQATNIAVETLAGIPIIEIRRTRLEGWGRILKRTFDIVFSTLALAVTSPILLLVALFIRADSTGPVLYKGRRIGQNGRTIFVYKFRSMVEGAEAQKQKLMQYNERSGPLFKMKNDPRITRIGRFLRRTSLDELPQFFNVLKGDMSVVGPRPHEPQEVARYEKHHKQLMTVRPGITGLAQVSGRSDLEFDDEARLDIFYIENWSFFLDFSILIKTPAVVLRMKSVA